QNNMHVYLSGDQRSLINSSSNLFTLRWDLRLGLFDQAGFVIVPKLGQLVVHFLQTTNQSAQLYHNVQFDHKNTLSHEALYARFTWALMKIVKSSTAADMKEFRFLTASDTDGGGDDSGGDEDGGGDEGGGADEGGSGGGDEDGGSSGGGGGTDACPREGRAWPTSHLPELYADIIEPDGSQLLLDSEAREFEEDMKTAAHTLPFFGKYFTCNVCKSALTAS
ncbi:hypothetical protein F5887DRAFT_912377, partial [Amanita rubescens]